MALIRQFHDLTSDDTDIAGGKGASLGEMTQAGIPVPPGFVILTDAFKQFIKANDLEAEIDAALHKVRHEEAHTVEEASERIQGHILNAPIPEDVQKAIHESFDKLDTPLVAVRSSATAEDASEEAWAGQLESFLNVQKDDLLTYVRECWASLFTPRAIFYRFENDLHDEDISVAVVVQKMVQSEAAGVAFSVHPVTENHDQMIIEAGFGLGDAVVGGEITPDSYVIEKGDWAIVDINVNNQTKQYVQKQDGGNEWQDLPKEKGKEQVLTKAQITELAKIIANVENHYGFPVDVEWAMEDGEFFVVQSRPITTLTQNTTRENEITVDKEFIVPRARQLLLTPNSWNGDLLTGEKIKETYGQSLDNFYFYVKDGYMSAVIPKKQWEDIAEFVSGRIVNDAEYFQRNSSKAKAAEKNIINFLGEFESITLQNETFDKLISCTKKIYNLFIKYDAATVPPWFIAGDALRNKIASNLNIAPKKLSDIVSAYTRTYVMQMKEEIMKAAMGNKNPSEAATELANKYYWVPFGYDGPDIWRDDYFLQQIKQSKEHLEQTKKDYEKMQQERENAKEGAEKAIEEESFNEEQMRLLKIYEKVTSWTDDRKMLDFQLFYQYSNLLEELGDRYDFTVKELKHLFTHELSDLHEDKDSLRKIIQKRQNEEFITVSSDGKTRIANSGEYEEIKQKIEGSLEFDSDGEIKGDVASKGVNENVRAKVRVVTAPEGCHKVKDGDLLVATMTSPDYIKAMERARGFITDEGGVTCHAAIVAREMNKLCIIGTEVATQVLEDGDTVEVDADEGVVKIIEKNDE